jgi:hydrogenase-1 operon protein HyaE
MKLHPLIQRLIDLHGAQSLTGELLQAWRTAATDTTERALLFSGDTVRFPEGLDVAVVLPELRAALGQRFELAVVPRESEDSLARSFGVQRWPSVVLLRGGGYLGTVSGMLDWSDYLSAMRTVLDGPVTRAPTIGIPVVSADTATGTAVDACH